ncbi:tyrosine kinase receptor Cad96Ca-like isoform X1 [Asterias amurensis]|uniref:tyrosine kinase receptor Cad96Ca-like isoform X1 n=1 Tax=Asterias amurensis TaxID=7602 RepID=UPI003AB4AEC6
MINVLSLRCFLLLIAIYYVDAGCMSNPCKNGGECSSTNNGDDFTCMCTPGWTGMTCETTEVCSSNPCKNGGTCVASNSGFDCECTMNWTGTVCDEQQASSPCQPNPCLHGGTCSPTPNYNDYNCQCDAGLSGKNCQSGSPTTDTTTIAIAVSVGVVFLLLLIAIALVCYVRRSRAGRNGTPQQAENGREMKTQKHRQANTYRNPPTTGNKSEFPRDMLHLFGIIGSGSFAVVYKAEAEGLVHRGVNTTVAVKMLKDTATPTDKSDFKKELDLYMSLEPHPNVVSMLGCCTEREPSYIILEYVPHGNMQTYLRHIRTGSEAAYQNKAEFNKDNLTPTEILTFACQVTRGMEYLASKQCIHRDLATRNILLGDGLVCKVADFGLARDIAEKNQYEMQSRGRVPVRWMAPESLINNMYTSKSDVWSFGVLLWELVTLGSHPYPGMSSQKVISELQKGYRLPKPLHCGDDIYKIMMDCWKEKSSERPDFTKLHSKLDILLTDATGYLEMTSLNKDDYVYLEPDQQSSSESE